MRTEIKQSIKPTEPQGESPQHPDAWALERLRPWFQKADIPPMLPATTQTVVSLLRDGGEYEVTESSLLTLMDRAYIEQPMRTCGAFQWTGRNIALAGATLEKLRRWQPFSKLHHCKKSQCEIQQELARANGETLFNDLHKFDFEIILRMLVETDDRQLRESLCVAVLQKSAEIQGKLQGESK